MVEPHTRAPLSIYDDGDNGVRMDMTTAEALDHGASGAFSSALATRLGASGIWLETIRDALQEALGNAVMHGNLELDSKLRQSLETMKKYGALMAARMHDPHYASRPITIAATWTEDSVTLSVRDDGNGFDIAGLSFGARDAQAHSGRGLSMIHELADSVRFEDQGRAIHMTFNRER